MSGIVSSQAMNFESKNLEIVKELENLKINEDQNQRDIESLKNHIENELESDIISEFIEKQADLSRKFNKTIEQNEKAIKDVLAVQKQFISTSKSEVSLWCLLRIFALCFRRTPYLKYFSFPSDCHCLNVITEKIG